MRLWIKDWIKLDLGDGFDFSMTFMWCTGVVLVAVIVVAVTVVQVLKSLGV